MFQEGEGGRVGIYMRKCQTPRPAFLREKNHKSRYLLTTNLGSNLGVDTARHRQARPLRSPIEIRRGVSTGAGVLPP